MTNVILLQRPIVRAIVVEQLNADQWHAVACGWPVPAGSWESHASGVNIYDLVVADALSMAECTGLPVLVQAHLDAPRALRLVSA